MAKIPRFDKILGFERIPRFDRIHKFDKICKFDSESKIWKLSIFNDLVWQFQKVGLTRWLTEPFIQMLSHLIIPAKNCSPYLSSHSCKLRRIMCLYCGNTPLETVEVSSLITKTCFAACCTPAQQLSPYNAPTTLHEQTANTNTGFSYIKHWSDCSIQNSSYSGEPCL